MNRNTTTLDTMPEMTGTSERPYAIEIVLGDVATEATQKQKPGDDPNPYDHSAFNSAKQ